MQFPINVITAEYHFLTGSPSFGQNEYLSIFCCLHFLRSSNALLLMCGFHSCVLTFVGFDCSGLDHCLKC